MSETQTPLLPHEQGDEFAERWQEIQASFVDRPQEAVQEADALVADLMQRITTTFAAERERLEKQWAEGDDVSTEDLRVALTNYRSFFGRLLST
jgi:glutathione S-transferase